MYEWQNHTGEAQLSISSRSPEEVFAEAIDALGRYVELEPGGEPAQRTVSVRGADRASLLVELLQDLIFLAETEGFVGDRAEIRLEGDRLEARIDGRLTRVDPLVKAATYHLLSFEHTGEVWDARVVLDV
jgi:SHS2 domain-containing protein